MLLANDARLHIWQKSYKSLRPSLSVEAPVDSGDHPIKIRFHPAKMGADFSDLDPGISHNLVVIDEKDVDVFSPGDHALDHLVQFDEAGLGLLPLLIPDPSHLLHRIQNLVYVAFRVNNAIFSGRKKLQSVRSDLDKSSPIVQPRKGAVHKTANDLPTLKLEIAQGIVVVWRPRRHVEGRGNSASMKDLHEQGRTRPFQA